jgi:hypothetical protein
MTGELFINDDAPVPSMPIPRITGDLRQQIVKSIAKVPFSASSKTPMDFFLLCGNSSGVNPDKVLVSNEDSMNIPDDCSDGSKPAGLFLVQPDKNGVGSHVISRDILRGLFISGDYGFVCSGYSQKVIHAQKEGSKWPITSHPKLLCVAPKEGATKAQLSRTINNLDTVFNMGNGFNSNGYARVLKESFDMKRWNLEPAKK